MEHICYDLFEELKEPMHIRELAKRLRTNHTTIIRKLNELEKKNVVDFEFEGKNKQYFRKKSLESAFFKKQVEYQKILDFIEKNPQYRQLIEDILKNQSIKLAIIFGSYAKNTQVKSSDLDLFIENISKDIIKKVTIHNANISIKSGKIDKNSLLGKEIHKKHIIIKGVDYYEQIYQEIM